MNTASRHALDLGEEDSRQTVMSGIARHPIGASADGPSYSAAARLPGMRYQGVGAQVPMVEVSHREPMANGVVDREWRPAWWTKRSVDEYLGFAHKAAEHEDAGAADARVPVTSATRWRVRGQLVPGAQGPGRGGRRGLTRSHGRRPIARRRAARSADLPNGARASGRSLASVRIGLLTGGGDCPGPERRDPNGGPPRALRVRGITVLGFRDGWRGVPGGERPTELASEHVRGMVVPRGGTDPRHLRGTRAALQRYRGRAGARPTNDRRTCPRRLHRDRRRGHDGHHGRDARCAGGRASPKTIDNDIGGTDASIGFWTAAQIRHGFHRPPLQHRGEPQPGDGLRGDGAKRRVDRHHGRARRSGGRHPDPGARVRHRARLRASPRAVHRMHDDGFSIVVVSRGRGPAARHDGGPRVPARRRTDGHVSGVSAGLVAPSSSRGSGSRRASRCSGTCSAVALRWPTTAPSQRGSASPPSKRPMRGPMGRDGGHGSVRRIITTPIEEVAVGPPHGT